MTKMKIYYYTLVNTEKNENDAFAEYPEKIKATIGNNTVTFIKDTIETATDNVEYGEG